MPPAPATPRRGPGPGASRTASSRRGRAPTVPRRQAGSPTKRARRCGRTCGRWRSRSGSTRSCPASMPRGRPKPSAAPAAVDTTLDGAAGRCPAPARRRPRPAATARGRVNGLCEGLEPVPSSASQDDRSPAPIVIHVRDRRRRARRPVAGSRGSRHRSGDDHGALLRREVPRDRHVPRSSSGSSGCGCRLVGGDGGRC